MQRLLEAEAEAVGLSPTLEGLSFRADGKGDGGVDALVSSVPDRPNAHIPGRWVFQAKTSWDLTGLKRQLKKQERAKKLLREGAGYTLIVNAYLNAETSLPDLAKALEDVVGRRVKSHLVGREQLARWLATHPQLLGLVPGLSELSRHLRTFDQWEASLSPLLPWAPDDLRASAAKRLARLPAGASCRVVGSPGVGKTRLVLEALRERANDVSYFPAHRAEVEELVATDSPLSGVLVVDECSAEDHDRLIRFHRSQLALITIGTSDDRRSARPENEILLTPLSAVAMHHLATQGSPAEASIRLQLTQFCGGYPKYFALLLQAIAQAPASERNRLSFDRVELRRLTGKLLEKDLNLDAARALALATWVDCGPGSTDLAVLERATRVPEAQFHRALEALWRRGLVGRRGSAWYVTPRLLAEHLAIEFWGHFADAQLQRLVDAHIDPDLLERCLERLERGSQEARAVLAKLGREARSLRTAFTPDQQARLVGQVAQDDPDDAFAIARELLREDATDAAEFASTLADTAWEATVFPNAVRMIAEAVERDPEHVQIDALLDLFAARSPLTQASPAARLAALEELQTANSPRKRQLAVRCATVGLTNALTFAANSAHLRARAAPPTHSEELKYRLTCAQALATLAGDEDPAVRASAADAASQSVRAQAYEGFVDAAEVLVEGLVHHGHSLDAARREVADIEEFDAIPVSDLDRIRALLAPTSLRDRFAVALMSWRIDFDEPVRVDPQLQPLIHELMLKENPEDCLALLSASGPGRFRTGQLLASVDTNRRLMPAIVDAQLAVSASTLFAAGYFSGFADRDDQLDRLAADAALARFVVDTTIRLDPLDDRRVARLRRIFDAGLLTPQWWTVVKGRYLAAEPAMRALLRPSLEKHPKQWLELAAGAVLVDKQPAAIEELKLAWAAFFPLAEPLDSDWKYATRTLTDSALDFVREFALRAFGESRSFPLQLIDVAGAIGSPWRAFAAVLGQLTPEEQMRVARTLRTRLTQLTPAEALAWLGRDEHRLIVVATMVPSVNAHEENVAAALLDAFPEHEGLGRVVHAHFNRKGFPSGTMFDSSLSAVTSELATLRDFAASGRRGLAAWARRFIPEHEHLTERAREDDDAERAGVPGWREPGLKISQKIYKLAEAQQGYFTAEQAKNSGCSPQLLRRYQQTGRVLAVRRAVYRLGQFPAGEHEDLVVLWLWSGRRGVFSHSTALSLHGLTNLMPERFDLTLPQRLAKSRMKVPPEVRLHFRDLRKDERTSVGAVPITTVERTFSDCAEAGVDPELLREARAEAKKRGLLR